MEGKIRTPALVGNCRQIPAYPETALSGNGNQKIQVEEVFTIGKTFLQIIAAANGIIDIIEIRIGIVGILYLGAVDTQLLANSLDDSLLWLTG